MVFGFFLFKHPVFGFYENEKLFFLVLVQFRFLVSRPFLVHVVRRHPGDVPGENCPQKAVEVLRNSIAVEIANRGWPVNTLHTYV